LQWDQETYLPAKGEAARARQLATLAETAHDFFTANALENILNELTAREDLAPLQKKNVLFTKEEFDKQKKFSNAFVRKMSETVSACFYAWIDARKNNDFGVFEPSLSQLLILKKEEANLLGFENHIYNALLHEYEKSTSVQMLDKLFDEISLPLKNIINTVQQSSVSNDFLHQYFPREKQWEWSLYLIRALGFDMEAGRQDISEHPFTTNFSAKDVRITTRINENDFAGMTWSCIHETGHALYEQGLPDEQYGLPCGEYASLSIHESQSRLWENCVGRSYSFWHYYYPVLKQYFPQQFADISLQQFYKGINKVAPSFIRTEADELTYHFHVKTRYTIEKELMENTLPVKDIRGRWNDLYNENLGLKVNNDNEGCLQDVHWSHGSFGYFPTYSLGSFYAAQFFYTACKQEPLMMKDIESGNTNVLLMWLRKNIHQYGRQYNSEELCEKNYRKQTGCKIFY